MLEQVQSFVENLRPSCGHNAPIMTPINQRVKNMNDIDALDKGRKARTLDHYKPDENNSSINTSPVLGYEKKPRVANVRDGNIGREELMVRRKSLDSEAVVGRPDATQKIDERFASHGSTKRRKSLKNPIDTETKRRLEAIRDDIGNRRKPSVKDAKRVDGIQGAQNLLVSRSSLGSQRVESDLTSIASGNDTKNNAKELLVIQKQNQTSLHGDKRVKPQTGGPSSTFHVGVERMQLPPHMQELKEKLKRIRYMKPTKRKDSTKVGVPKPRVDLSGLKMAKEFDPRRMPMDFFDSGNTSYDRGLSHQNK